jgi:hypothetical protein
MTARSTTPEGATAWPWIVREQSLFESIYILEGDEVVLEMEDGPEARAKADLIVRAVNERDELIAALRDILDQYVGLANSGDCGFWDPEDGSQVKRARAALAKAEGR